MMKAQLRKKLKKHERLRHRYVLVSKDNEDRVKYGLSKLGVKNYIVNVKVRNLNDKAGSKVVIKVNRRDIEKIRREVKGIIKISGTLKGLLR